MNSIKTPVRKKTWQPTISNVNLRKRAKILAQIRAFFAARNVLEVETPMLGRAGNPDPHIDNFITHNNQTKLYLQTSPEFHMKRLLAQGSGPIFQLGKAFRQGEEGHRHNPEFTLLEWYRPGFDHFDLMQEVDELLQFILKTLPSDQVSYQQLFQDQLKLDPHQCSQQALASCAGQHQLSYAGELDRDGWLNLLLSHLIEPKLGQTKPLMVTDFPASQAALARIEEKNGIRLAARFEVYYQGIELANGYYELSDALEQQRRFQQDNQQRREKGQTDIVLDDRLVSALKVGLPDCAGVALGVDRLVMLATASQTIAQVMSFPIETA